MNFPHVRSRRPARALLALGIATSVTLVALLTATPPADAAQPPDYHPSQLAHVGASGQVIVVTAPSWTSTHATLRAYERDGKGGWAQVVGATPARLGWSGLVTGRDRRQGSGKTPAGTFGVVSSFGRLPDPGTKLRYTQFDRNDAWTYNPKSPRTYNVFQNAAVSWRSFGGYVEQLWSHGEQYRYVAVLDFNLPDGPIRAGVDGIRRASKPANTRLGGGIFLHVSDGRSTAGCIAVPERSMRQILTWLDPHRKPVIVVGPSSVIDRM